MCPHTDFEANHWVQALPETLLALGTSNLKIGLCLENRFLSNDIQQHTVHRRSWTLEPHIILLGICGPLVGPKY